MDGKKYPARLVDMPCVLETQKTLDRSTFFKSGDVGQMLIVYKVPLCIRFQESKQFVCHFPGEITRRVFLFARGGGGGRGPRFASLL